jgi:hypothetical protein
MNRVSVLASGLVLLSLMPGDCLAQIDEERAISAGAEALDSWWNYPWYDDSTDDIRRINLQSRSSQSTSSRQTGPRTTGGSWDLEWLGWVLIAMLTVGIVTLLVRIYLNREAQRRSLGKAQIAGAISSSDRLEELPFELSPPEEGLLAAARRAYEAGDFSRAIILLYSHQLIELDRHDAIHLTKGKTNRQYLRELRPHGGAQALLATSMVAFEDAFFGGQSPSRERLDHCFRRALELLSSFEAREAA